MPRLPRKVQVDVTKCRTCHAKVPRLHARPRGPKRANCLGPNPNGRCSPLSFEVLVVSTCLAFPKLRVSCTMPFFLAWSYVFLRVLPEFPSYNFFIFPTVSSSFLGFATSSAMVSSQLSTIFQHSFLGNAARPLATLLGRTPTDVALR